MRKLPFTDRAPQCAVSFAQQTDKDARMQWWRDARFGMFIHWGVYAVPAGTYKGFPMNRGGGEWIMNRSKIPVAEYQAYAQQFNPTEYDAEQWVKMAKDAGMKYIVITAKHHDGFALFDSKASAWDIADATPYKKISSNHSPKPAASTASGWDFITARRRTGTIPAAPPPARKCMKAGLTRTATASMPIQSPQRPLGRSTGNQDLPAIYR